MQYDTGGNPIIFYDMCAYCNIDTGGQHQYWCPCYQPINEPVLASEMKVNIFFQQLAGQGLEEIGQGRYKPFEPLIEQ